MGAASIETSVSTLQLMDNDVLHWTYHLGSVVTIEAAEEEVSAITEYLETHDIEHVRLLIDIRPIKSISRKARALFASREISERFVIALGLVIKGPVSRMIGNFYLNWNRPFHPTRLFNETRSAAEWLSGQTREADRFAEPPQTPIAS